MIEVFEQETIDGIVEKIKASCVVSYTSKVEYNPSLEIPDNVKAHMKSVGAYEPIADLFPIRSILVSTGINLNDDWFGCEETFAAKDTVANKPFNYNHDGNDIIGHMTASQVVDEELKPLDITPLPAKFHIINSAYLYKIWDNDDKQKRMDKIVAEITSDVNSWAVSMECLLKGFNYILIPVENNTAIASKAKIVERNKETAHLSKYLKIYGGAGIYNGYKIGRALKNITFSGIGLVKNPANPESIILNSPEIGIASEKFNNIPSNLVYESSEKESNIGETMSKEKTELETVVKTYSESEYKELKDKLESSTAELTKIKTQYDEVVKAAETAKADTETVKTELKTTKEKLILAETEVAKARKADRLQKVKEVYGFDVVEDAEASVDTLSNLSDEAFEKHLVLVKKTKPVEKKEKIEASILEKTEPVKEEVIPVVAASDNTDDALQKEMSEWYKKTGKKEDK